MCQVFYTMLESRKWKVARGKAGNPWKQEWTREREVEMRTDCAQFRTPVLSHTKANCDDCLKGTQTNMIYQCRAELALPLSITVENSS